LHFSGTVPLLPGANRIVAYGRDRVGNLSGASRAYEVERVTEVWTFEVPKPLRPGDHVVLRSRSGWSRLAATVFNLQGDRIHTWEERGPALLYRVELVWDGRNASGEGVGPGPYLLHVRASDAGGHEREEVKAFVFQR